MTIDRNGLALLLSEASALTSKPKWTSQDERRNGYLLSAIAALKTGEVTLADIDAARLTEAEVRNGLPVTISLHGNMNPEQRAHAKAWQQFMTTGGVDFRDEGTGIVAASFLNGNNGQLVPIMWLNQVFAAMKAADPLFDPEDVTYIETTHGRPIQVGIYGDIENVATVFGEGVDASASETDISKPGQVLVGAYSYRSPLWRTSLEALQDLEISYTESLLFQKFAADRMVRGAGKDLINGNGSSKPLGLVPSLVAAGVVPTIAAGSSGNDGIAGNTGANSIGSADLAKTFFSVNSAYRESDRAAWLMNDTTLQFLASLNDKVGHPVVKLVEGIYTILGKPVKVSPSMDNIGASNNPVVFGDLSYWCTRCARDPLTYVRRFTQTAGLIEKGEVGFRLFARFDGKLLWNDTGSPAPLALLQNHS